MVICLHNEIQLVTKSNTFSLFFVSMTTSVLRSKKQNSFRFWYIYTCFIIHLHLWNSLLKGRVPSVHPGLDLLCRLLPVTLSCFLSVGWWAWPESAQEVRRAGEDSHLAMYTFMVGPWLQRTTALFPQVQNTHLHVERGVEEEHM